MLKIKRSNHTYYESTSLLDVPSTPGKPLIMKFDSRSVELSWSPPLHVHYSEISHYIIHILEGEETDWSSHQAKKLSKR